MSGGGGDVRGGGIDCRAAVQWTLGTEWGIEEIRVDPPRRGEVRVRVEVAGLCHSDHTLFTGGYPEIRRPIVGGHEGAGVVDEVGPGVVDLVPGDPVVLCVPVPACGFCAACLRGLTYLCERGQFTGAGRQISDGTARHHARGKDLGVFVFLGTFGEFTVVDQWSCLKINPSLGRQEACTVACAGVTGWGSVQNTARFRAGETAVVIGIGGVGANALMAARFLGAADVVAVDPLSSKRALAAGFGANVVVGDFAEAREQVGALTRGRMADVVIMAMGVGDGSLMAEALSLVGKRGRVVVVNSHPDGESSASIRLRDLQSMEKQVLGCLSGSWHGRKGASFLLDLAERGLYDPGRIVDATYDLDHLAQGYEDQLAGRTLRGVVRMHGDDLTADERSRARSEPAGSSSDLESGALLK